MVLVYFLVLSNILDLCIVFCPFLWLWCLCRDGRGAQVIPSARRTPPEPVAFLALARELPLGPLVVLPRRCVLCVLLLRVAKHYQ